MKPVFRLFAFLAVIAGCLVAWVALVKLILLPYRLDHFRKPVLVMEAHSLQDGGSTFVTLRDAGGKDLKIHLDRNFDSPDEGFLYIALYGISNKLDFRGNVEQEVLRLLEGALEQETKNQKAQHPGRNRTESAENLSVEAAVVELTIRELRADDWTRTGGKRGERPRP